MCRHCQWPMRHAKGASCCLIKQTDLYSLTCLTWSAPPLPICSISTAALSLQSGVHKKLHDILFIRQLIPQWLFHHTISYLALKIGCPATAKIWILVKLNYLDFPKSTTGVIQSMKQKNHGNILAAWFLLICGLVCLLFPCLYFDNC